MAGLHRYNDILESFSGMSPNVLSDRLGRLEAECLVVRNYYKELPPRVEYTLTEKEKDDGEARRVTGLRAAGRRAMAKTRSAAPSRTISPCA